VLPCIRNIVFLCVLDNLLRFYVFFCFFLFCLFCGFKMDMSSIEEDQIVYDATQVVRNSGALPTMMGLHDVLRNIEQMLTSLKRYVEASEAGMVQVPLMAQISFMTRAPPMSQALPIAQTTHANVLVGNTKEPKFIIPEKFDGAQSMFCGFIQQVNLILQLHSSCYSNDSM
jgi:hypothetical protein